MNGAIQGLGIIFVSKSNAINKSADCGRNLIRGNQKNKYDISYRFRVFVLCLARDVLGQNGGSLLQETSSNSPSLQRLGRNRCETQSRGTVSVPGGCRSSVGSSRVKPPAGSSRLPVLTPR
jgi:hypothetical protein